MPAAARPAPLDFGPKRVHLAEGVSVRPLFSSSPASLSPRLLFWEHEGNRAVRAGRWKLVAKDPAGPWELYDLETDRTEMRDLAASQPARTRELAAQGDAWARRANAIPWPHQPQYGEAEKAGALKKGMKKKQR